MQVKDDPGYDEVRKFLQDRTEQVTEYLNKTLKGNF